MKAKARHELKQNDFAQQTARAARFFAEHQGQAAAAVAGVAIVAVLVGGYFYWHKHTADEAGALLALAQVTAQATITPPSTLPGAGQVAGTFPTEQTRSEAALKAYETVVTTYPSSAAALAARYNEATELMALGRFDEANQKFQAVIADGGSSVYKTMAQVGSAETLAATGKYDDAIKAFTDLSAARDSVLPIDGVLMQLAQVDLKAGKTADARSTFKRVVDEFPDSDYVSDAKQQIATLN